MKKVLGIVVLSLLWCNPVLAKEIWLMCIGFPGEGRSGIAHSFIIDDIKKTVIHNGQEVTIIKFNEHIIEIDTSSHGIKTHSIIDRITSYYNKRFKCAVVKKHSF